MPTQTHPRGVHPLARKHVDAQACFWFGASLSWTSALLAIGAPRARWPCASAVRAGQAFLYDVVDDAAGAQQRYRYVLRRRIAPADAGRDLHFGAAVAVQRRAADGGFSLLVGAPGANAERGAVYWVDGAVLHNVSLWAPRVDGPFVPSGAGTAGARYGHAVAIDPDGQSPVGLVGAPDAFTQFGEGAGVVHALLQRRPRPASAATGGDLESLPMSSPHTVRQLTREGTEPGDQFGVSVAVTSAGVVVIGATGGLGSRGSVSLLLKSSAEAVVGGDAPPPLAPPAIAPWGVSLSTDARPGNTTQAQGPHAIVPLALVVALSCTLACLMLTGAVVALLRHLRVRRTTSRVLPPARRVCTTNPAATAGTHALAASSGAHARVPPLHTRAHPSPERLAPLKVSLPPSRASRVASPLAPLSPSRGRVAPPEADDVTPLASWRHRQQLEREIEELQAKVRAAEQRQQLEAEIEMLQRKILAAEGGEGHAASTR